MRRILLALLLPLASRADGPADNIPDNVRPVPPVGLAIPDDVRAALTKETEAFAAELAAARQELKGKPAETYLPDAEIFHKAVAWALQYNEFFDLKQTVWAADQLREGQQRLAALRRGEFPWLEARGLVVRAYRSKIDGSVQPFGLVVPGVRQTQPPPHAATPLRLDIWFHGRGEKLTELDFIHQRQTNAGEFTHPDTIVLHPYGRYCNGSRFAGETDCFEALAAVQRDYRIDPDRIVVRGFSLGGAACWHMATHHPHLWAAANPGAGFSETEQFLNFFQGETLKPFPWERQLWNLYDATTTAGNLRNCPTVAYSGAKDRQKQAADLMATALESQQIQLTHIVAPDTAHQYEPAARAEVARRIDALARRGRLAFPSETDFTTFSLHTNRFALGSIDALAEHWKPARIRTRLIRSETPASLAGSARLDIETENITAFTLSLPPGSTDSTPLTGIAIRSSNAAQPLHLNATRTSDGSVSLTFHFAEQQWRAGPPPDDGLRKRHGLQGPIDDAFMDSFLFVRPTGTASHPATATWAQSEMDRAIREWRRHFRGDARSKADSEVTPEDIDSSHLILWGDPASNAVLARIAPQLPIQWSASHITTGPRQFAADHHALVCIYPNPLNPSRYVVLNSGFTFREYDYLNNARQTPKLPDWAVIDLTTPANSRYPGAIPAAGFFSESWQGQW